MSNFSVIMTRPFSAPIASAAVQLEIMTREEVWPKIVLRAWESQWLFDRKLSLCSDAHPHESDRLKFGTEARAPWQMERHRPRLLAQKSLKTFRQI